MQIIVKVLSTVAEYIDKQIHRQMSRPERCPNCDKDCFFEALGYYQRDVTDKENGKIKCIRVRRFLCRACSVTVSLLPCFCHPYHVICHDTISDYFVKKKQLKRFYAGKSG